MERKIGEIFECNDEFFQCVESSGCALCAFNETDCNDIDTGSCEVSSRSDGKSVVFKKLEKVGGLCKSLGLAIQNGVIIELYKTYTKPILPPNVGCILNDYLIAMEIKNKEDMETTEHSNSENIGKNLKPFDLEAAKSGKPVCTRDGRKARIICFDRKDIKPIVALVTSINGDNINEKAFYYFEDGHHLSKYDNNINDLMMLPEKKEGWVNLYRDEESKRVYCGEFIFSEREKAEKHYECNDTKVATVPVNWEE